MSLFLFLSALVWLTGIFEKSKYRQPLFAYVTLAFVQCLPICICRKQMRHHDYGHRCIANAWRVVCWQCAHKHFNVCCRQFPKMESERERKTDGHAKNVHKREMIMVWRDIGAIVSGRLRITRWLNPLSSISVLRASLNSCSIIMLSLSVISVVF